jgi:hypothetical protein
MATHGEERKALEINTCQTTSKTQSSEYQHLSPKATLKHRNAVVMPGCRNRAAVSLSGQKMNVSGNRHSNWQFLGNNTTLYDKGSMIDTGRYSGGM